MQIGLACHWQARTRTGPLKQLHPHCIRDGPAGQNRRAGCFRWQRPANIGVVEQPAVAIVAVALGRQHVTWRQLDMIDLHFLRPVVPQDGAVVDQILQRKQHAPDEQVVTFGHARVAMRHPVPTRSIGVTALERATTRSPTASLSTSTSPWSVRMGVRSKKQSVLLSSTKPKRDADTFARVVRSHRGIENGLHWVLDVVFHDDLARLRSGHGLANMAIVKHAAMNLLSQAKPITNLKNRRKRTGWNQNYLEKIIRRTAWDIRAIPLAYVFPHLAWARYRDRGESRAVLTPPGPIARCRGCLRQRPGA